MKQPAFKTTLVMTPIVAVLSLCCERAEAQDVVTTESLTIMNPVERWWGEGDEKIFIDRETFPSIFGTAAEDYYAYSWGGVSTDFHEHPFHAQPGSHRYNKLNRKTNDREKNTQGYSTETRTRALDTMPFAKSLQLDMEVWSWTDWWTETSGGPLTGVAQANPEALSSPRRKSRHVHQTSS